MNSIYRKSSLEKISSPEQLDKMLHVTSPMSWVALTGLLLILIMGLFWGIYGEMNEKVETEGIYRKNENAVLCYVPLSFGKKLKSGMQANVVPTTVNQQDTGYMKGYVASVSTFGISREEMLKTLGDELLVDGLREQERNKEPVIAVVVTLIQDTEAKSGYAWSNEKGKEVELSDFTPVSAYITTDTQSPLNKMFGNIFRK